MKLRVVDAYKTTETAGYRGEMPIVHCFGRDTDFRRHHVEVEGFRPYFCVPQQEWVEQGEQLAEDDRVVEVTTEDRRGRREQALDGTPLVRVVCRTPGDVADLRELFENPMEADVLYPVRFLVDHDVRQWIAVPDDAGTADGDGRRIDAEEVQIGLADIPEATPPPRVCTYDIEVQQGGRGPPVVSAEGTERADNPITAITAHDSYTDDYRVWVLAHPDWTLTDSAAAREAVEADVSVYDNPANVAGFFCEYLAERDFDVLTAWNGDSFDHPYLVNYCLNNGVNSVYSLSPTRDVYPMNGDGNWINSSLKGRVLVDLLDLYDKTQVHTLDSYKLADVAATEGVAVGKLDLGDRLDVPDSVPDIDYAWQHHPDVFVEYSLRDVQAAVGINTESQDDITIV